MSVALRCPRCRTGLDTKSGVCANGHEVEIRDGVLRLLEPGFGAELENIEASLGRMRRDNPHRIRDPDAFEGLPFSLARHDPEWALRAADAGNIIRLLTRGATQRILDLGAWNGWLSHRLAALGHEVVAADYFADPYDGLGAQRHYRYRYHAIQTDLTDLSPFAEEFDLVIVNHGLAFFTDPAQHLRNALDKVRPGGRLAVLGLQFFRDPEARIRQVEEMQRSYLQRFGEELFFRPTRAYLDWADRAAFRELGMTLRPYRHLWRRNLMSRFNPQRPYYCYGTMARFAED